MDINNFLKKCKNGAELLVYLTPSAKHEKITGIVEINNTKAVKISVRARPIDNMANIDLIKFLSYILDIPKSSIEIMSGHSSRLKKIHISY